MAAPPRSAPMGVWKAQFSPDGRRIVTCSDDGTARTWDFPSGQPLGDPLREHGSWSRVGFSPDGSRLGLGRTEGGAVIVELPATTPPPPWLADLAWQGQTAEGAGARLFRRVWTNPRPDTVITTLDFISAETPAAPFLVAVTVAP